MRTLRDWIAARDATIIQVRHSLDERDTQLAALQQEHAKAITALEARADAISSQLRAHQEGAAVLKAQLERSESRLNAALTELGAVKRLSSAYLESLRTREWRRGFDQNMFQDLAARVDAAEAACGALRAERDQLFSQVQSLPKALEIPDGPVDKMQPAANVDFARAAKLRVAVGGVLMDRRRVVALSAAVLVLGVAAWFVRPPRAGPGERAGGLIPGSRKSRRGDPRLPDVSGHDDTARGSIHTRFGRVESVSASFEKPLHRVLIRRPFAMSTNVVTVDDFRQFVAATGRDVQGCDTYDGEWKHRPKDSWRDPGFAQTGTHPVTCVSWNDAEAYARWLSTKTGRRYRLPSASEWEYAARAGGESVQPWRPDGSGACANANVADESAAHEYPGGRSSAVMTATSTRHRSDRSKPTHLVSTTCWATSSNGLRIAGTRIMPARRSTDRRAQTANCAEHELRGGSWFTTPAYVRADYRNHFTADYRTSSVGIRLVRDI